MEAHEGALGQQVKITTAIRGILEDYDGSQVLAELVQNADDARASTVSFLLDLRTHSTNTLLSPTMAQFQGPALCAFNNAVFRDEDFESIQNVGAGRKSNDPIATGRFGLGFNSVYHMTDLPSFITRDKAVFFDPHRTHLPGIEHGPPGKYYNFTIAEIRAKYADQFAPYALFGCDLQRPFDGTIFRFPLRSADQARVSELVSSRLPFTPDDVLQIFDKFIEMGSQILLHLKFLREVTLYVWNAGQTAPEEVYSVGLDKSVMKEDEMQKRASLFLHLASKLEACKGNIIKELAAAKENIFETMLNQTPPKDFPQDIYNVRCIVKGRRRRRRSAVADSEWEAFEFTDHWMLSRVVGQSKAYQLAKQNARHALFPLATVAALVSRQARATAASITDEWIAGADPQGLCPLPLVGRAFCTLPLPLWSGLPVHVNAGFALSRDRRSIISGSDVFDKQLLVKYNQALLTDAVAWAYARLLLRLADDCQKGLLSLKPEHYYQLWPKKKDIVSGGGADGSLWSLVVAPVLKRLLDKKVFACASLPTVQGQVVKVQWVDAKEALFFDIEQDTEKIVERWVKLASGEGGPGSKSARRSLKYLAQSPLALVVGCLLLDRCPLVSVPLSIYDEFVEAGLSSVRRITPAFVRQLYRQKVETLRQKGVPFPPPRYPICRFPSLEASFVGVPESIAILKYALSDIGPFNEHKVEGQNDYTAEYVSHLPFLCLASNECTTFANGGSGSVLCESKKTRALAHVLLRNCANLLIHSELVRQIGEFRYPPFQEAVGVRPLTLELLGQLLNEGRMLPLAWRGLKGLPWRTTGGASVKEWIEHFWEFVRSEEESERKAGRHDGFADRFLAAFGEWPLLPVREGQLVSLERLSLVINRADIALASGDKPQQHSGGDSGEQAVCHVLERQLRYPYITDDQEIDVVGRGFVPQVVLDRMMKLSPKNLVAALHHLIAEEEGRGGLKEGRPGVEELCFSVLSAQERDLLLHYIARGIDSLGDTDLVRLRLLPLFPSMKILVNEGSPSAGLPPQSSSSSSSSLSSFTSYTSLKDRKWYTLPEDFPLPTGRANFLHGMAFLLSTKAIDALYLKLGILPLSRASLYVDFVFPAIEAKARKAQEALAASLSHAQSQSHHQLYVEVGEDVEREILHHLEDVRMHFEQLMSERAGFADILSKLPVLRGMDGCFYPPSAFVDPTVPLLYAIKREWALPPTYARSAEWLLFFRRLGLADRVDASIFLGFASGVSELAQRDPVGARQRAILLIQYLNEHYNDLCPTSSATSGPDSKPDSDSFWEKLREVEFVPCMEVRQETEYTKRAFYRFAEVAEYWDFELMWSQAPILEEALSPPYNLKRKLKIISTLYSKDVDYVVRHLNFMIRSFANTRIYVAGRDFAEKRRSKRVLSGFRDIYRYLDRCCGESDRLRKALVEKLGCDKPWIYHLVPLPGSDQAANDKNSHHRHQAELGGGEVADRYKVIQFIAPSQVFHEVEEEVPSLMYRVPTWLAHGYDFLLEAFAIEEIPNAKCSLTALHQLMESHGGDGVPLPSDVLAHVLMLLGLIHAHARAAAAHKPRGDGATEASAREELKAQLRRDVRLPDERGVLRRPLDLFMFDTPWLKGRIALTKPTGEVVIPILHPNVSKEMARFFGVRLLSLMVHEEIDPRYELEPSDRYAGDVERWQLNLSTDDFKRGVVRLIAHERGQEQVTTTSSAAKAAQQNDDENRAEVEQRRAQQLERLEMLRYLRILPAKSLQTRLIWRETGDDVTVAGGGAGSLSVLDVDNKRIYLATPFSPQMLITHLANQINHFLFSPLKNMQPLCAILDCEEAEAIAVTLNILHISFVIEEGPVSKLGLPLSSEEVERLDFVGKDFKPGDKVGITSESVPVWAEIQCRLDDGHWLVLISTMGDTRKVREDQTAKVKSLKQQRHEERERRKQHEATNGAKGKQRLIQDDNEDDSYRSDAEEQNGEESGKEEVELIRIEPADPDHWKKEYALAEQIKAITPQLEPEPPGIDEFIDVVESTTDKTLGQAVVKKVRKGIRPGYDIVRWGNIDEVAFFHVRTEPVTDQRLVLAKQAVDVLRQVARVFDYQAYFVCLFYQKDAVSRFVEQRLLFNIYPLEEHMRKNNVRDLSTDPSAFAYLYFYGLFVHKLGHFFDIVHGTRHDFFMNELRIEFKLEWLNLLEAKGFDLNAILAGPHAWMLEQTVF